MHNNLRITGPFKGQIRNKIIFQNTIADQMNRQVKPHSPQVTRNMHRFSGCILV